MDSIRDTIESCADKLIQQEKAPVYKYPGEYAREHGELELYRTSGKANVACKQAIETAVNSHWLFSGKFEYIMGMKLWNSSKLLDIIYAE